MGVWASPDTVGKASELARLLRHPVPARLAHRLLWNLVGDDRFFGFVDQCLQEGLPEADTSFEAARTVGTWLEQQDTFFNPWEPGCVDVLARAVADAEARQTDEIEARARMRMSR